MAKFEKMRNDALLDKNKAAMKAMELEGKTDDLKEKSDQIKEGISRIPKDLPDELQLQIDAACERVQAEMKSEAKELENEAYDAQADADQAFERMHQDGQDLQKKGDKLIDLRQIPLIGSFADAKGRELKDDGDQLIDIAKETQSYSNRLAEAKNKLMGI